MRFCLAALRACMGVIICPLRSLVELPGVGIAELLLRAVLHSKIAGSLTYLLTIGRLCILASIDNIGTSACEGKILSMLHSLL